MILTRMLTRIVMGVALVCASIAWSGWAYLHTAAAPHRVEDVADAVLADPDARFEIAGPLADQIVESTGVDPAFTPRVRQAVADAMADPRVGANVAAAFGSVHARAVGVSDDRPATVDGALLVAAVKQHLATADPELAAAIPDTAVGSLTLPEYHPPFVASLRTIAVKCTNWLALLAVALLACAFIVGDRKYVLRRFGVWAIVTGLVWAIGPRIIVFAAHRWAPQADATIDVAVGAATSMVVKAATALVAVGIGSIIAGQFVGVGRSFAEAVQPGGSRPVPARTGPTQATYARTHAPAAPSPAQTMARDRYEPVERTPIAGQARATPPVAPVRPTGWGVGQFTAPQPYAAPPMPAPPPATPPTPPTPPAPPTAGQPVHQRAPIFDVPLIDAEPDEVDPWAHFSGPAVKPPPPRDDQY